MIKAKVCGISNSENLKSLLTLPVDMVGFIFNDKSKRNCTLSSSEVKDAFKQYRITAKKVGVFVDAPIEEVAKIYEEYELDYVQLHGNEGIFYCQKLKEHDINIIKTFSVDDNFCYSNTSAYSFFCDFFLFDAKKVLPGVNGFYFNWDSLERYQGKTPFLISGGFDPEDVDAIRRIEAKMLSFVDLNSAFEMEPGYKNLDAVADFIYKVKRPENFNTNRGLKKAANG